MAFRKHSLIVLFSLLILSARAQSSEQNGYVKDFTILTASLKELYPMLYKMRDSASLENSIRDISGGLLHARSRNEALYLFQSFMYEFGDVHAGVESIYAGLEVEKILPFKIILIGDSLFIKDFPSQPAFIGSRIESINGHKTENIIDSLNVLYGTDGNHVPGLVLQPLFNSFYAAFIEQSDSFRVATNKGIFWTHCIKKGDTEFEKMTSNSWKNYMVTDHDWVKMEINTDYAYFRFLSFDKKVNGINIETEFNKMLDELAKRNIPNLVIDLRYNSGGDPYMAGRMASRLVEEPFAVFERLIVLQPSTITYPKNLEIDRSYAGDGVIKVGDHFEKMKGDKGLKPVMPAKNIFKGKIYVLTGPMTESTSTMFCKYLSSRKNVIFVGSETPGAINYFCAHKHCLVVLPNTNARVSFGLQLIELKKGSSDSEKPQGLVPDVKINYSINDFLERKDKEMEWVINAIASPR